MFDKLLLDNRFHTSWIFLQVLADNMGKEAQHLIEHALDFETTQETALNLIRCPVKPSNFSGGI